MGKKPVNLVGYFAPGGRYGYISARFAQAIEAETHRPISKLFQGGVIGGSVGSITASVVATDKMSMQEYSSFFLTQLPKYMPHDPDFYPSQIRRDVLTLSKHSLTLGEPTEPQKSNKHIDRTYMCDHIRRSFSGLKMSDARIPLFITAQRISPDPLKPHDFYWVDSNILKDERRFFLPSSMADTSISDAILASTAMQTVFPAYNIEGHQAHYIDMAHMDGALPQVDMLEKSLKNGFPMGVIQFDSFLKDADVHPNLYNNSGVLRLLTRMLLTDMPSLQSKLQSRRGLDARLGENYKCMEIPFKEVDELPFDDDILNTSEEQCQAMLVGMDEYLAKHRDARILPVVDFLVENAEAWNKHAMEQSVNGMLQPKVSTTLLDRVKGACSVLSGRSLATPKLPKTPPSMQNKPD